jgi:hypothetical protein
MQKGLWRTLVFLSVSLLGMAACSSVAYRPCTQAGQPPRESPSSKFRGTKRCYQIKDSAGNFVNDGKYFEWHLNEKIAIEGEYEKGKKSGRWIEYDENGNKISDQYFINGKEVPRP